MLLRGVKKRNPLPVTLCWFASNRGCCLLSFSCKGGLCGSTNASSIFHRYWESGWVSQWCRKGLICFSSLCVRLSRIVWEPFCEEDLSCDLTVLHCAFQVHSSLASSCSLQPSDCRFFLPHEVEKVLCNCTDWEKATEGWKSFYKSHMDMALLSILLCWGTEYLSIQMTEGQLLVNTHKKRKN